MTSTTDEKVPVAKEKPKIKVKKPKTSLTRAAILVASLETISKSKL
jgi:hypothetical protein